MYDLVEQGVSDEKIVEELYLAALSRYPTKNERRQLKKLISSSSSQEEALRNLQWGMLRSREFAENH